MRLDSLDPGLHPPNPDFMPSFGNSGERVGGGGLGVGPNSGWLTCTSLPRIYISNHYTLSYPWQLVIFSFSILMCGRLKIQVLEPSNENHVQVEGNVSVRTKYDEGAITALVHLAIVSHGPVHTCRPGL